MKILMQRTGAEPPVVVMKLHNRSGAKGLYYPVFLKRSTEREEPMNKTKSYEISEHIVLEAFKIVKMNHGAAGIDGENVEMFDEC